MFGVRPDLLALLRAELSYDEHVIAIALHPNIWSGHSPWQVRQWLADCERDGVLVLPPEEGWRAGLVAADLVIGDGGSVTYYGAALGRPVLLALRGSDTVDPASTVGRFLAAADVLTERRSIAEQVRQAMDRPASAELTASAALVTSAPGESHALLRRECYRLLRLSEPDHPATTAAVPIPRIDRRPITATAVAVHLDASTSAPHAHLTRHAAGSVARGVPPRAGTHLVVSTDEPARTLLESADIIVHDRRDTDGTWLPRVLRALPGAWLATQAVGADTWWVATRDGTVLSFTSPNQADGSLWASLVHAWLSLGHDPRELPRAVRATVAERTCWATVQVIR